MNKNNLYLYFSVAIFLTISLLGGLSLHETFSGDQALFVVFSREIDNGAVLYRDIWDIKQPAIFVFYLIAGKLFSFSEFGVHLLELIYWLSLTLIMVYGLRNYFTNYFSALLTPLFTVGIYYSVSGSWHLTQAESLVCFPLFLCLWFCQKFLENPNQKNLLFFSGIFGGIVLLFKQMLLIIPCTFWLGLLIYGYFLLKKEFKILTNMGLITIGFLIPVSIVVIYFLRNDSLSFLFYTTFIYPYNAAISVTDGDRTNILKDGLVWFFKSYLPVILLTVFFLFIKIKNWLTIKTTDIKPTNFLFIGLFLWTFLGLLVILIQRLSWWQYHYSLLMLPLGVLAVKGLENLYEKTANFSNSYWKTSIQLTVLVIIMLSFIPTVRRLNHKVDQYLRAETVKIDQKELKITGDNLENYSSITAETAFLLSEKQRIFVMADPLYYYLSNSSPAISSNGWMPTLFTQAEWEKLNREMNEKKPGYVFLEKSLVERIRKTNPEFINELNDNYSIYSAGEKVLLYKIKM